MKIVWICYSADNELQKLFSKNKIPEQAPWISSLKKGFLKYKDIELHIISPNYYLNRNINFRHKGITYHYYKRYIFLPKKVYSFLRMNYITSFWQYKHYIFKIINNIKPDIIHLFGTENSEYSIGILPLVSKYHIFVTIQGFRNKIPGNNYIDKQRKIIENKIIQNIIYFGIRTNYMKEYILLFNKKAKFYWHILPFPKPVSAQFDPELENTKYDVAFWGRVVLDKGIEDLIYALSLCREKKYNISLLVCGGVDNNKYLIKLQRIITNLNLTNNIYFTGWIDSREELFKLVSQAKICVLPTHYDNLPGTVLESMYIGIPVIVNNVDGMDILNRERESVVLVDKGNIQMLADNIITLLNDNEYRKKLSKNSKITAMPYFNNDNAAIQLINIYNNILNNDSVLQCLD